MSFVIKARTALALGVPNLVRALTYRLGVKTGLNPVRRLKGEQPTGPFFALPSARETDPRLVASQAWLMSGRLFSRWPIDVTDSPPDWHSNPLTGKRVVAPEREWWRIPDFDPAVGDIKLIWETSRFDWVLPLAQRVRMGDVAAHERLERWLVDWSQRNPPYRGPNWKCGQEASIRVMHLAMAAVVLGQVDSPEPGLLELVRLHLQRIEPTIRYAIAQDNNHGTSEAAALFIGGSWLARNGVEAGARWEALGRKWLDNRAVRLITLDGTFSQYSVTYHRLMLDTYCMAEVWRRHLGLAAFPGRMLMHLQAATRWFYSMVRPENGDAPNLGASDGARLLQLTDTDYREFRPSVQLATALFWGQRAYEADGVWNQPLLWLGVELPERDFKPGWLDGLDDGGFGVLRCGAVLAVLRYPRFRFRPSHPDALHIDLWLGGRNLLRDGGSYSYNTDPQWPKYFGGTVSHNTVQFDDRDQMPRVSRFLLGDWLRTIEHEPRKVVQGAMTYCAAYRDGKGAYHRRRLAMTEESLQVQDRIEGFVHKAVLRWRLEPGEWKVDGNCVRSGDHVLRVQADVPLVRFELTTGWESRYYLEKTELPVLEIEVDRPGTLISEYRWVP